MLATVMVISGLNWNSVVDVHGVLPSCPGVTLLHIGPGHVFMAFFICVPSLVNCDDQVMFYDSECDLVGNQVLVCGRLPLSDHAPGRGDLGHLTMHMTLPDPRGLVLWLT